MSLMQLLAVGQSLSRPIEAPSRFRLVGPGWLPKFRPEESPLGPSAGSASDLEKDKIETAAVVAVVRCRENALRQQILPLVEREGTPKPAADSLRADAGPVAAPVKTQAASRGRWALPAGAVQEWPKRALMTRKPAGSIAEIKVVRNDLNEEDLAVIPARSTGGAARAGETKAGAMEKGNPWSGLMTRLLHACWSEKG
jgi:hypothetical protein